LAQGLGNTALEHTNLRNPQNLWVILFGTTPDLLTVKQRWQFPFRTADLLIRVHGTEILTVAQIVTLYRSKNKNSYDKLLQQK
jgi:predicted membrane protein